MPQETPVTREVPKEGYTKQAEVVTSRPCTFYVHNAEGTLEKCGGTMTHDANGYMQCNLVPSHRSRN